ncbi:MULTISPECIES: GGDEF domain-containing protein [unclassified Leptolyngbya]|uniref:diguanylate cyclase n=1 Tax=unclassified Leptolyngbya TaxID=2650499 RepID=UPI001684A220|nr:GGDEF domain-containing protein [Leptolyngbya sp. FACHB-16]
MNQPLQQFDVNRLMQLAQATCQVPTVLLVLKLGTTPRYSIASQIGWPFVRSAEPLARPLFERVESHFSGEARAIQGTVQTAASRTSKIQRLSHFRTWAGIGLGVDGQMMGALLVLDTQPRTLNADQLDMLSLIAEKLTRLIAPIAPAYRISPEPPSGTTPKNTLEQLHHLNAMSCWMQSCITQAELFQSLAEWVQPLIPDCSGRILLSHALDVHMTVAVEWGEWPSSAESCVTVFCPVMRTEQAQFKCSRPCRDRPINLAHPNTPTALPPPSGSQYCVPITTMDQVVLGALAFWQPQTDKLPAELLPMGEAIAQQLALTLWRLQHIDELQQRSIRDPLTGLFNRRYLAETLPHLLHRALRGQHLVSIILLDLDHFKRLNDQFGHLAGDQVLRDFSLFLKGFVRGTDIACRYGGEEFILILPQAPLEKAQERAERIRQGLHYISMHYAGKNMGNVTLSAGVATFPRHGDTADILIAAADKALYQSKLNGRDRVTVFEPSH